MDVMTKKKLIIASSSLILIAVIGIIAWNILRPQAHITFRIAPSEVTMVINNTSKQLHDKQIITVPPGEYHFEFSKDGYSIIQQTLNIKDGDKTQLSIALLPQSDSAKKEFAQNTTYQTIAKDAQQQSIQRILAATPLTQVGYTITSCPSLLDPAYKQQTLCITLDNDTYRPLALSYLQKQGIDPVASAIPIGSGILLSLLSSNEYTVSYSPTIKVSRPAIYIAFPGSSDVAYNAPFNQPLESARQSTLNLLTEKGYDVDSLAIFYTNIYLSRYNYSEPDEHQSNGEQPSHASAPVVY